MRAAPFICVAIAAMLPMAALADNPLDPAMRNSAARARDREITRNLNLHESAAVRQRDAGYARERRSTNGPDGNREYAAQRAQYERDMAAWRRAVSACRAGDYSACGG